MRSILLLVALASAAYADDAKRKADREAGGVNADAMLDAVQSASPANGAKFMTAPLRYTNFKFADPGCAKRFARSGSVAKVDLAPFATCMASMRGLSDEFWFVSLTTDKPDADDSKNISGYTTIRVDPRTHMVVAINHHDGRLDHCDDSDDDSDDCGVVGGVVGGDVDAATPPPPPVPRTVTMADIVRHLHSGSTMVRPDSDQLAKMRTDKRTSATVDVFTCFNSKGDAIAARAKPASDYPRWDAAVTKAAMQMTITPFDGTDKDQVVCATLTFTTGPLDKAR